MKTAAPDTSQPKSKSIKNGQNPVPLMKGIYYILSLPPSIIEHARLDEDEKGGGVGGGGEGEEDD